MTRYQYDSSTISTMENSPVPFAIYQFIDKRVVTLVLSAGFCGLFGFTDRSEAYRVMDNDMYRDVHPDDTSRIADAAFRFATEGGEYNVVYRTYVPDREAYIVIHAQGKHIYTETGVRLAVVWYTDEGIFSEEGSREEADLSSAFSKMLREGSMVHQSHYDTLTGLPNMTYFFELADAGIKNLQMSGKQAAVLFIDLCGMKAFNARHGFSTGDRLIREFGNLLAGFFSNENCSRFGQDHFAVFTGTDHLETRLEELFRDAEELNDGNTLPVRVGICIPEDYCLEIGEVCDRAKMACDTDRNVYISGFHYFSDAMLTDAENRRYIIDNLDKALEKGWIKVYNQPIIRAANGRVCDEEALSRWIDPVRGFLSPAEFIPTLEEARLIYKLDLFVVDQILTKMKLQAEAGLYVVPESVNLSRADFDSCDIVEEIRRRVDEAGIGRDKLTIEITESVIGSDFDFMKTQVERFRSLGFAVWMDDFGSGYSSLDLLQEIRFDLIKFDMRFMQKFEAGDEGRIILTELVKMALGLGVETVCEGVETASQAEFLKEIGCTKLQGFYFCRPIPWENVLERYRKNEQIGFENPEESEYYTTIGRINLYDMAVIASGDSESFRNYFDTLPTAIIEVSGNSAQYIRGNKSYRDFAMRTFGTLVFDKKADYSQLTGRPGSVFMNAVIRCSRDGNQAIVDEMINETITVHSFIRRVAVNPVNGKVAVAVAVLAVTEADEKAGTTYAHIARALSADYINLYYVSLETEEFIEYTSDASSGNLAVERHGGNFFEASRRDAMDFLYKDDREYFRDTFTKENVVNSLDEYGTFNLSYRLLMNGNPVYVSMKVVRMQMDPGHIIIGVSNVDAQKRQQEAFERIQAERTTYARIMALSGDFICIYTVDPSTNHYIEYSATRDYEGLGLAKEGEDFFAQAKKEGQRFVYNEDVDLFVSMMDKEKILQEIRENGVFVLNYRMLLDQEPTYITLKAALVEEQDGPQLIIGVINIDAQVRREQEYESKLSSARTRANLDVLTGVKNKVAYQNVAESLTQQIEDGQPVEYAIVLCMVQGLDQVNDTMGKKAGDQVIREACSVICQVFKHSPVFRVKGNEFAVISQGQDYEHIDELMARMDEINAANRKTHGAVIACGMAKYDGIASVASIFHKADELCRSHVE